MEFDHNLTGKGYKDFSEILTVEHSNGQQIQLLLDRAGRLTGKILFQGKEINAKVQGLPTIVSVNQVDKLKRILHRDCRLRVSFDEIEVLPRLRGGLFDPITWGLIVSYGPLVVTGVGSLLTGVWLKSGQSSAPPPPSNSNSNTNSHNLKNEINIVFNVPELPAFPGREKWGSLLIGLPVAGLVYGSFYCLMYRSRNQTDATGNTLLHKAVMKNNGNLVRQLLNVDSLFSQFLPQANIDAKNNDGDTSLHFAVRLDFPEIAGILYENQANYLISNNSKETPYDMASASSSFAMKKALNIKC